MKTISLFIFTALILPAAFAQASLVSFTAEEIRAHRNNIELITQAASTCLDETYQDHTEFFDQYQFSKYFGNRNPIYATVPLRYRAVRSLPQFKNKNDKEVAAIANLMKPTACITLAVQCLGQGFKAAGAEATWDKIIAHLKIDNKFLGTDLQSMLRGLGWKIYYWNPDPSLNAKWDEEDRLLTPLKEGRSWMPVWGGHAAHYGNVMKKKTYLGIPVDDNSSLVGFGKTQPAFFKSVPFFLGTAHAGYHVFPGYNGGVIEAHSMRKITSRDNLEVSEFNPLGTNGGPRWTNSEKYRSGIIAVPPGY